MFYIVGQYQVKTIITDKMLPKGKYLYLPFVKDEQYKNLVDILCEFRDIFPCDLGDVGTIKGFFVPY